MADDRTEQNYSSDEDESDDEEYVPTGVEDVSEEEGSGEDEDFVPDDSDDIKQTKSRRQKQSRKSQPKSSGTVCDDLKVVIEAKKEKDEKKRADDLWADFMKDVGPRPKQTTPVKTTDTPAGSSTKGSKPVTEIPSTAPKPDKVTITKVFDFAGEEVKVTKEVDAGSKEALSAQKAAAEAEAESSKNILSPGIAGVKRPAVGGGLGSVLGKIGKKSKITTLEKSKMDWDKYKQDEGIDEELKIFNRGKGGYIERKAFLERTDLRQFEIEKSVRQGASKR